MRVGQKALSPIAQAGSLLIGRPFESPDGPGSCHNPQRQRAASMVIHSGSALLDLAYLVTLVTAIGLLVSLGMLAARKFRTAAKVAAASAAALGLYLVAGVVIGWMSPQTVVTRGDSYCWDLWCMGIQRVQTTARGAEMVYTIDVRFFSDANSVKTGMDEARLFLVDDRGRRFSLVEDRSVIPINTRLDPGQSLETSLTFVTPDDATHLFLTGDAPVPGHLPVAWRFLALYMDLHIGYEKLAHKPTLLRVI